jgi:hypothetical protein
MLHDVLGDILISVKEAAFMGRTRNMTGAVD